MSKAALKKSALLLSSPPTAPFAFAATTTTGSKGQPQRQIYTTTTSSSSSNQGNNNNSRSGGVSNNDSHYSDPMEDEDSYEKDTNNRKQGPQSRKTSTNSMPPTNNSKRKFSDAIKQKQQQQHLPSDRGQGQLPSTSDNGASRVILSEAIPTAASVSMKKKLRISEFDSIAVKSTPVTGQTQIASLATSSDTMQCASKRSLLPNESGLSILGDSMQFLNSKDAVTVQQQQQQSQQRKRSLDSDGLSEISYKPTKKVTGQLAPLANELDAVSSELFEVMEGPRERSRVLWIFNSLNFIERLTENASVLGSREFKTGNDKTWSIDVSYDSKSESIGVSLRRVSQCTGEQVVQITAKIWVVSQSHDTIERSATARKRYADVSDQHMFAFPLDVEVVLEKYQHVVFSITIVPLRLLNYCSRRETGFVGIENEGMTCYINSFLQTLFHLKPFVKMIYAFPTDAPTTPTFPHTLQKLFYELQTKNSHCSIADLLKSFAWDRQQARIQQDIQEFSCLLLDFIDQKANLIKQMQGKVRQMFSGKIASYIRCSHVNYESVQQEPFIDISLSLKGFKDIYESLDDYVREETLSGENKYDTGTAKFGKQDAKKGTRLLELPSVLIFHLKRFEFDFTTNRNIKITDRHEYYDRIDMTKYLVDSVAAKASQSSYQYRLFGVLVHTGDMSSAGHYYAFIRPNPNQPDHWYKFNDTVVERSSRSQVFEHSFGGSTYFKSFDKSKKELCWEAAATNSTAYMLIYINEKSLDDMCQAIPQSLVPQWIIREISSMNSIDGEADDGESAANDDENNSHESFEQKNSDDSFENGKQSQSCLPLSQNLQFGFPSFASSMPSTIKLRLTSFDQLKKESSTMKHCNALLFHKQSLVDHLIDMMSADAIKTIAIDAQTSKTANASSNSLASAINQIAKSIPQFDGTSQLSLWRIQYDAVTQTEKITSLTKALLQPNVSIQSLINVSTTIPDVLLVLPLRIPSKKSSVIGMLTNNSSSSIANNSSKNVVNVTTNEFPSEKDLTERRATLVIVKTIEATSLLNANVQQEQQEQQVTYTPTRSELSHYFFIRSDTTYLALCSEITRVLPTANMYDFVREQAYSLTSLSLDKQGKTSVKVLFNDCDAVVIVVPLRNRFSGNTKDILSNYAMSKEMIRVTFKARDDANNYNNGNIVEDFVRIESTKYSQLQSVLAESLNKKIKIANSSIKSSKSEEAKSLINAELVCFAYNSDSCGLKQQNQLVSDSLVDIPFYSDESACVETNLKHILDTQKSSNNRSMKHVELFYSIHPTTPANAIKFNHYIQCKYYSSVTNTIVSAKSIEKCETLHSISDVWQVVSKVYQSNSMASSENTATNDENNNSNAPQPASSSSELVGEEHLRVCEIKNSNSHCIVKVVTEAECQDLPVNTQLSSESFLRFELGSQSSASDVIFACHSSNTDGSIDFDHPFIISIDGHCSITDFKQRVLLVLKNRKTYFRKAPVVVSLEMLTMIVSDKPKHQRQDANTTVKTLELTNELNEQTIHQLLNGIQPTMQQEEEKQEQMIVYLEIRYQNINGFVTPSIQLAPLAQLKQLSQQQQQLQQK